MPPKTFFSKISAKIKENVLPKTDWKTFFRRNQAAWASALSAARGQKILIATGTGGHEAVTPVESLLAIALTLRGAGVDFLLCDEFLPACMMQTLPDILRDGKLSEQARALICARCHSKGRGLYAPLGLPIHSYSQWADPSERVLARKTAQTLPRDQLRTYFEEGAAVGEHATAGALRFFAKARLNDEARAEEMLRRYLEASLLTFYAARRLMAGRSYDAVVFHHGIYVPQGVIGEAARQKGARVVNWNVAYRRQRVIFSHEDTYHYTLLDEPCRVWEPIVLSEKMDAELEQYLKSREAGSGDWIAFHEPSFSGSRGLRKPYTLLLTNVAWDAQIHYPANVFSDMMTWIFKTLEYFIPRPEKPLVIRVHPAETRGIPVSRQRVIEEIHKRFSGLPLHITLIGPDEPVSTYRLAEDCDAALIYGTKMGVELAARGIPVIVAGEAWVRNKGISFDARSREEYFSFLERLPMNQRLKPSVRERARKYAYHFFFRRMIPLKNLAARRGVWPPLRAHARDLRELYPGQDAGLDVICDGILNGSDFIYDEPGHFS